MCMIYTNLIPISEYCREYNSTPAILIRTTLFVNNSALLHGFIYQTLFYLKVYVSIIWFFVKI